MELNYELVSVIMPAYNAENTLSDSIMSVLKQSYPYLELIIVDDCSTDRTLEIAQAYAQTDSRIRVISNGKNSGVSMTRHRALEAAEGKWLAFLDSDDIWQEQKLEKQMIRQRETGGKLIFTGSRFMNAVGTQIDWTLHVPQKIHYRRLLKQNLISNSSVLVEKECYRNGEVIGEGMHEDFACWLRILGSGVAAYGIDEPLLIYRLSPNSKSGNKLKAARMNWNTYRAVGLHVLSAAYYMVWYSFHGLRKYSAIKNAMCVAGKECLMSGSEE